MGYLFCEDCNGYYELQPGESPEDFEKICQCGGKLRFVENLNEIKPESRAESSIVCPSCGFENPEDAKLCKSCHKVLKFSSKRTPNIPDYKEYKERDTITNIFNKWNEKGFGFKAGSILGIVLLIGLVGAFAILPAYNSMMYNYHLGKASTAVVNAKDTISQVEPLQKPTDTNIQLTNKSMSYVDEAIYETQQMSNYAPDKATKDYADLRLKQFQEVKRWMQMGIRGYEEMKTSGTLGGALVYMASSGNEIDAIWKNVSSYQNQIIQLVNNNPDLKQRLVNTLGNENVNKALQTYNPQDHAMPYV